MLADGVPDCERRNLLKLREIVGSRLKMPSPYAGTAAILATTVEESRWTQVWEAAEGHRCYPLLRLDHDDAQIVDHLRRSGDTSIPGRRRVHWHAGWNQLSRQRHPLNREACAWLLPRLPARLMNLIFWVPSDVGR